LEGPAPVTSPAEPQPEDTSLVLGRTRSATQGSKSKSPDSEVEVPSPALPSTRSWKPEELVALEALYKATNGTPEVALRNKLAFDLNRYV
jgi:hypothetical protein